MTPAVADVTARRLQARVATEQVTGRLPSLVAGVARDGELVWSGAAGEHAGGAQPTNDTQYRIGSLTKTMTAVLVLQLRDRGRLGLADPVSHHLPEVEGYRDRTLRDLLGHSSGMHSEPVGPWWERSEGRGVEDLLSGVRNAAAPFAPGTTYHYSNVGYGLLGEVVARVSGMPWRDLLEQRVLAPLRLTRTTYRPTPPHATGYSVHPFAGTLDEEPARDTGAMAPAGQLWSTVSDLVRYATFLLEGRPDVLSRESLAEMATPRSGTAEGGLRDGYGLGLRLVAGGSGTLVGHTGSMPGFLAGLLVDPGRRTAAVCLANATAGLRCDGLTAELLSELESCEPTVPAPWRPVPDVPRAVSEVLGLWYWGNTALAFRYDGQDVVVSPLARGPAPMRFRAEADGTFRGVAGYHHGERLRVVHDPDGRVNHLECATFVYTREPYEPRAPIPGGLPHRP